MYQVTYGPLAAAVSNAGGLGMIGSGYMEPGSPVFSTSQNAGASVPRKPAQLLLECVIEAKRMLRDLAASYDELAKRAEDRKHAAKP